MNSLDQLKKEIIAELEPKIQKHLESAITHGWNDAQEDNDGLSQVCKMEAQQNLRNTMADISSSLDKVVEASREETIDSLNKTFLGICLAVVMAAGKSVGDSMIIAWDQALDKLKSPEERGK